MTFIVDIYKLYYLNYLRFSLICFRIETIDKCFSHDTVEDIIDALVGFIDLLLLFPPFIITKLHKLRIN